MTSSGLEDASLKEMLRKVMKFQLSCLKFLKNEAVDVLHSMSANLESSSVTTVLEKVSFHSNPKERKFQRMFNLLRESFPRQVDKKSRGPQGEKGLEFSRKKKGQTFFPSLHFLGLYNNNVFCLRTVSGLNLLANSVKLKCEIWE